MSDVGCMRCDVACGCSVWWKTLPRTTMVSERQVVVEGGCGSSWLLGRERAEVVEVFIPTRVRGPGVPVERTVSIDEHR